MWLLPDSLFIRKKDPIARYVVLNVEMKIALANSKLGHDLKIGGFFKTRRQG